MQVLRDRAQLPDCDNEEIALMMDYHPHLPRLSENVILERSEESGVGTRFFSRYTPSE